MSREAEAFSADDDVHELLRRAPAVSHLPTRSHPALPYPDSDCANPADGQGNVRRWIGDILRLLSGDGDPLGVEDYATHRVALEQAPYAYDDIFQRKQDGAFKALLQPHERAA